MVDFTGPCGKTLDNCSAPGCLTQKTGCDQVLAAAKRRVWGVVHVDPKFDGNTIPLSLMSREDLTDEHFWERSSSDFLRELLMHPQRAMIVSHNDPQITKLTEDEWLIINADYIFSKILWRGHIQRGDREKLKSDFFPRLKLRADRIKHKGEQSATTETATPPARRRIPAKKR